MLIFRQRGNFNNTERFIKKVLNKEIYKNLDEYGMKGVEALRASTPVRTGLTADSWDYKIIQNKGDIKIVWTNSNFNKGEQIAVLIQYGHGTGNGGYVQGRDYINPSMRVVFDEIAEDIWREVVNA